MFFTFPFPFSTAHSAQSSSFHHWTSSAFISRVDPTLNCGRLSAIGERAACTHGEVQFLLFIQCWFFRLSAAAGLRRCWVPVIQGKIISLNWEVGRRKPKSFSQPTRSVLAVTGDFVSVLTDNLTSRYGSLHFTCKQQSQQLCILCVFRRTFQCLSGGVTDNNFNFTISRMLFNSTSLFKWLINYAHNISVHIHLVRSAGPSERAQSKRRILIKFTGSTTAAASYF